MDPKYRYPKYRDQIRGYVHSEREVPSVPTDTMRKIAALTDEQVEEYRADMLKCTEANKATYDAALASYFEMCRIAEALYGEKSSTCKYLKRDDKRPQPCRYGYFDYNPVKEFEEGFVASIGWFRNAIERHEGQAARDAEATAAKNDQLQRAILFLTAHDKTISVDYTLDNAVYSAHELSVELEVEQRIANLQGSFVEFNGDDSCENCRGWDGESPRCDCGNRRVSWVRSDYSTFEKPEVYADAH